MASSLGSDNEPADHEMSVMSDIVWNSLIVCILLGICAVVALFVGNSEAAALCIGALAGVMSPPPYKP